MELASLTRKETQEAFVQMGFPAYRGTQVFEWIHKGADFADMANLPKNMRQQLQAICVAQPVVIMRHYQSKLDGTVKFLFSLMDGNLIEGVLMRYHHGVTLCISTQVGCRMGCKFCASTVEGCVRDLTSGEMLGQILAANQFLHDEARVHNVVLMGSGEPFDNYGNVVRFLKLLREEGGVAISLRNVSVSTCGIVPKMLAFADEGLPATLCVSLHAPNDAIRGLTMPIAKRYPMEDVIKACRNYIDKTGRRVVFEYALVKGVNDSRDHARELVMRLRGMQCHVNLIPLNTVFESPFKAVTEDGVSQFQKTLEACGISVTRRREMGDDIGGACGQLRRGVLEQTGGD